MADSYSVAETKDGLTKILRLVERRGHVHITRRGKPVAVVMSVEEFDALQPRRLSFMEALKRFKETVGDDSFFDDAFFDGLRDPSPGREVDL